MSRLYSMTNRDAMFNRQEKRLRLRLGKDRPPCTGGNPEL